MYLTLNPCEGSIAKQADNAQNSPKYLFCASIYPNTGVGIWDIDCKTQLCVLYDLNLTPALEMSLHNYI